MTKLVVPLVLLLLAGLFLPPAAFILSLSWIGLIAWGLWHP